MSMKHSRIKKGVNRMPSRKREPRTQAEYYTLEEVSIVLNLGKTKVRDLIQREHLPTVTFGRAIRVPIDKFATWRGERERRTSFVGNKEFTKEQSG
jgi:excisionase family DNA binding protein